MSSLRVGRENSCSQDVTPQISYLRFWGPRFWPTWLLVAWLKFTSCLPWRAAIGIHTGIGWFLWLLMAKHRHVVAQNIRSCFPELSRSGIRKLVRRHFGSIGACMAETAFAWFGKVNESLVSVRIEGDEHVYAALSKGHGVILCTGHFTPVEICGPPLKATFPLLGFMFHRRRNALLNEIQRRGREYSGHLSFESNDVRAMLAALRRNAVVWYAPDQRMADRNTVLLKFFGQPMMISTAAARIARISGAAIVPFSYRRLPKGRGYGLRFEPAIEDNSSEAEHAVTARLTEELETAIRRCPEQYAWTHQFLKRRLAQWSVPGSKPTHQVHSVPKRESRVWSWSALSSLFTIVGVALFITLADNGAFFSAVATASMANEHSTGILLSMFLLVFGTLVVFLALMPGRRTLKLGAALLLIVAAAVGYFMSFYGIVVDPSMIRNVMETDAREASGFFTATFLMHMFGFGVVPAAVVLFLPPPVGGWRRELGIRVGAVLASVTLLCGTVYANFGPVSFFAHQNHAVRLQINPLYPLYALLQYETRADDTPPPVRAPLDAWRVSDTSTSRKPTLFLFVMGETARADRFSFNGYDRDTNRFTREKGVVNFGQVSSCGTSTADSVPCIFSRLGRADFSHARFAQDESLVQTLDRLGVAVAWRDNSTGCKDVCIPDSFEDLAGAVDSELCSDNICVDEILLKDLDALVAEASQDRFIVLHQRGSHGPAYYKDTPDFAKAWLPECDSPGLRDCDSVSINNAYDNTILYTDYFLAQAIEFLQAQSDRYETALLYVSDHGESLGEKGLYLHGVPYSLAPREQTHVPMVFWASETFYSSESIDQDCLRGTADTSMSHDSVFHTLLPVFDINSAAYDPKLDVLAGCRQPAEKADKRS